MIPILYATMTEGTIPTNYGIGCLTDCLSCKVTEERNGAYELEMEYSAEGIHADEIIENRFIMAKPNYTDDPQIFRIYKVGKIMNGRFSIYGQHVSYDLSGKVIRNGSAASCVAACALLASSAGNFSILTDKSTDGAFNVYEPSSVRSWFGGKSGSLLDVYGGEWSYNNYTARLNNARGTDRGVQIRYGKNLLDIQSEADMSNLVTGVVPFYIAEDGTVTSGTKVSTGLVSDVPRDIAIDFSPDVNTESSTPIITQLNNLATAYVARNNLVLPVKTITLDFVQMQDLKDRVDLCDTVHIYFEALGINATAKCIKSVWDVLEDRYTETTFGDPKTNICDNIIANDNAIADIERQTISKSYIDTAIENATELITGNLGGYVVIHDSNGDGKPDEVLIMDTDDISTATKVWRWNKNGLGYSSTGYAGTYGLAMTADGAIVADFITAGTMSGNRVRTGLITSTNNQLQIDLDAGTITAPSITLNGENVGEKLAELEQTSVVTTYALSNSGTNIPTSFPLSAPTQPTEAQPFLWSKTVYTYADGDTNTSYTISVRGANGTDGADGHGLNILGNYDTMADLIAAHPTGNAGDVYMVGGDLVVWDDTNNQWNDVGRIQGPSGFDGLWLAVENDDTGANMNVTYTAKLFKGVTDVTSDYNAVFVWEMVNEDGVDELAANTATVTVARDAANYGSAIRCICICIITEENLQDYAYAAIQDYSGNDIQIIGSNAVKLVGDTAIYKPYAISSQFQVLNDQISSKVEQTSFNSLENTVTNQGTLIQQNADAILLKADTTTVNSGLAGKMATNMSNRSSSILIDSGQIRFDSNSLVVNSSQFTLDAQGNATFGGNLSAATLNIGGQAVGIGTAISDAESDAVSTASADATSKANAAQANAISTAASDATTKANNAKNTAISTASADATTKANNALNSSKSYTDTGLATKVGNDEVRTKFAVDTHSVTIESGTVKFKSNTLLVDSTQFKLDASGNATFNGNLTAATLVIGGSSTNIGTAINNAQSTAISTASADATTKANNALTSSKSYTDTGLSGKVGNSEVRTKFAADTHSVTISSGTIGFTSNTLTVDSTNFKLTANGTATATNFDAKTKFRLLGANDTEKAYIAHNSGTGTNFAINNESGANCASIWCTSNGGFLTLYDGSGNPRTVFGNDSAYFPKQVYIKNGSGGTNVNMFSGSSGQGEVYVGDGSAVNIYLHGGSGNITCVSLTQTSSRKVKENIKPIEDSEKILLLDAVSFDYKNKAIGTDKRGFIAEDVAEVLPNLVTPETDETPATLDYVSMIPYLQDVIKKQQAQIDYLTAEVEKLKGDK